MITDHEDQAISTVGIDDSAVREIVARASESQNDTDAFLELHTPDTIIVNIVGRRVLGRDALAQAMKAALASPLSAVRTSVAVVDVRFPGADLAVASCIKTVHDERVDADRTNIPSTGALTYAMVRTPDGWRIAHAQTTPIVA